MDELCVGQWIVVRGGSGALLRAVVVDAFYDVDSKLCSVNALVTGEECFVLNLAAKDVVTVGPLISCPDGMLSDFQLYRDDLVSRFRDAGFYAVNGSVEKDRAFVEVTMRANLTIASLSTVLGIFEMLHGVKVSTTVETTNSCFHVVVSLCITKT